MMCCEKTDMPVRATTLGFHKELGQLVESVPRGVFGSREKKISKCTVRRQNTLCVYVCVNVCVCMHVCVHAVGVCILCVVCMSG